jgi:WD40 repeat protein
LWKFWQEFRLRHSGEPEYRQAAEVMSKAFSPLDKLDRLQIRTVDCPASLPDKVVAVLGENRGREWSKVRSVAVSPDGKLVATCTFYGVRLWDVSTMAERAVLRVDERLRRADERLGQPLAATFSPDCRLLAVGYERGMVLWDISAARPKQKAIDRDACFTFSLFFVHGGQSLMYVGCGLRTWDINAEVPRRQTHLKGIGGTLGSIVSPDGRWLLASGPQKVPSLWDLHKPDSAAAPLGDVIAPYAFSADSKTLVGVTATKRSLRLWDVRGKTAQQRGNDLAYPDKIHVGDRSTGMVAFTPDGTAIARLFHGQLTCWPLDEAKRNELRVAPGQTHRRIRFPFDVEALAYTPDGKALVLGGADGTVRLWEIASDKVKFPLLGHIGAVSAIAFTPDCRALVSTGADETMRWWNLQDRRPAPPRLFTDQNAGGDFVFAPQGRYLINLKGNDIHLWDMKEVGAGARAQLKTTVHAFDDTDSKVVGAAFSPNGRAFAATGTFRDSQKPTTDIANIRWWDFKGGTFIERDSLIPSPATTKENTHPELSGSPVFTGDSKHLLFVAWDRWRIWDLKAPKAQDGPRVVCPLLSLGHDTFTGFGGRVAALEGVRDLQSKGLGYSFAVRIWEVTGKGFEDRACLSFGASFPLQLCFSLDGRKIASIDNTDHFAVWDVVSRRKEYDIALPGRVLKMAFAPDCRHLATANANGTIYIYRLAEPAKPETE